MNVDDAIAAIVTRLRASPDRYRNYGYDIYLPEIWEEYFADREGLNLHAARPQIMSDSRELSSLFYTAAWELCRRGILRPSIFRAGEQITPDGQAGNGYSLTPAGRRWIEEADHYDYAPTEPSRQAEMLAAFRDRFGPGFYQRAQEAVRNYQATTYLSCCVMCGAAAESILLAVAIAKTGDDAAVLKMYRTASGRRRVENAVVGQVGQPTASRFRGFTDLLNYWRDDAGHGVATPISEIEAYDSLGRLLRFAHFVGDNWEELVTAP